MHFVNILGIEQIYCLPEYELPKTLEIDGIRFEVSPQEGELMHINKEDEIRTVLIRKPVFQAAHVCYLLWSKPIDVLRLDELVSQGKASSKEFENVVVCAYKSNILCIDSCLKRWKGLIGLTGILHYVSRPEQLQYDNLEAFERQRCPNCGTLSRINVIKIFEENKEEFHLKFRK